MNRLNGHRYVGVTSAGMPARRRGHRHAAKSGSRLPFACALRKYGEDAFDFRIIGDFGADHDLALIFEMEEIAKTSPEYNVASGGQGGWGGRTHSDESKARMRAAKLGKPGPWRGKKRPDMGPKLSASRKGIPNPKLLGHSVSPEAREKIRVAKLGRKLPPKNALQMQVSIDNMRRSALSRRRPVICIDDGRSFPSITAAAEAYGETKMAISKAIGRAGRLRGRTFRFAGEVK